MRRQLRRPLPKYSSLHLQQRLVRVRQDPVAAHAIKVSDDAMAAETTLAIEVARTQVRAGTATTVVAIVTIAIEAPVVKVGSEVKRAPERKVAVTVVATEAALASGPRAVAIVTDHAARVGRTRVVDLSKASTDALIRVPGRIRLRVPTRAAAWIEAVAASKAHVLTRGTASIKASGVISLPALNRAKARFEMTLATA